VLRGALERVRASVAERFAQRADAAAALAV
jgi:hypothetical protein